MCSQQNIQLYFGLWADNQKAFRTPGSKYKYFEHVFVFKTKFVLHVLQKTILNQVDGKQIEENYRIFVSRYVLKKDRKSVFESRNACTKAYTNLYVKNFNSSITEDRLRKLFEVKLFTEFIFYIVLNSFFFKCQTVVIKHLKP